MITSIQFENNFFVNSRCTKFMASNTGKKLIQIDVSSDTVCPWCFVGKRNLEKAMEQTKDKFDFEVSLP